MNSGLIQALEFHKYHSLENDFLILEESRLDLNIVPNICQRHLGFGADGILQYHQIADNSFQIRLFNSDGSEASFSGNGYACLSQHIYRTRNLDCPKLTSKDRSYHPQVKSKEVCLPLPSFSMIEEKIYPFEHRVEGIPYHLIEVGNEHAVFFETVDTRRVKEHFSSPSLYPDSINISLAQINNPHQIDLRVLERGCGFTRACSSGALATGILAHQFQGCVLPLKIDQSGGPSIIDWDPNQNCYTISLRPQYIGKVVYEGKNLRKFS
jgi:diaminopimelate epimerase